MKVENLITDEAIKIVFENTRFGTRTPREMIAKDLDQVKRGFHVGYTMQCCLLELGLIFTKSHKVYGITPIGEKYLELLATKTNQITEKENKDLMKVLYPKH